MKDFFFFFFLFSAFLKALSFKYPVLKMGSLGREFDISGLTDLFRVDLCEFSLIRRLYDGVD